MATIKNIKVGDITYNIEVSYIDLADSGATTTSTSGTITNEQLTILQSSKQNCIIFDNQIYRLQDNEHNSGILTYTYNGYDSEIVSKTITITISTLGWTLTELSASAGGTNVVANNGETTSATLNTLKVGETNYAVPSGGGSGGSGVDIIITPTTNENLITFNLLDIGSATKVEWFTRILNNRVWLSIGTQLIQLHIVKYIMGDTPIILLYARDNDINEPGLYIGELPFSSIFSPSQVTLEKTNEFDILDNGVFSLGYGVDKPSTISNIFYLMVLMLNLGKIKFTPWGDDLTYSGSTEDRIIFSRTMYGNNTMVVFIVEIYPQGETLETYQHIEEYTLTPTT